AHLRLGDARPRDGLRQPGVAQQGGLDKLVQAIIIKLGPPALGWSKGSRRCGSKGDRQTEGQLRLRRGRDATSCGGDGQANDGGTQQRRAPAHALLFSGGDPSMLILAPFLLKCLPICPSPLRKVTGGPKIKCL